PRPGHHQLRDRRPPPRRLDAGNRQPHHRRDPDSRRDRRPPQRARGRGARERRRPGRRLLLSGDGRGRRPLGRRPGRPRRAAGPGLGHDPTGRPHQLVTPDPLARHRPNVGVVLFNAEGLVWLGRRVNTPGPYNWQFPQGGVDAGEDWESAARRELREETGVVSVEPLAATDGWIAYDFPPEHLDT